MTALLAKITGLWTSATATTQVVYLSIAAVVLVVGTVWLT